MATGYKGVGEAIEFYCCSVKMITLLASGRAAYIEYVFI